ncbi:hypothetical protein PybrP1_013036 [[Pythium] brassicae (nom. inval.)]|nr:hypothetical protein PybrP1_013036 [[Pythium] brassicae (nom. inval.)]
MDDANGLWARMGEFCCPYVQCSHHARVWLGATSELAQSRYDRSRRVDDSTIWDLKALCEQEKSSRSVQLMEYSSHRFLGMTRVIERILEKWTPFEE